MSTTKERQSNIELYRILCMLCIVAHHYVVNSGLTIEGGVIFSNPMSIKSLFLLVFGAWGKTGINCFLLITGYFMCTSTITLRKYTKLLLQIYFYRIVIFLLFLICGYGEISWTTVIKTLLPVTELRQNFTGCFLIFFLFIPFLNSLIRALDKRKHRLLILLCFLMYVVFGTMKQIEFNYASWFMVLYLIASYIRMYPEPVFDKKKLWGGLSLLCIFVSSTSVIVCEWLGTKLQKNLAYFFVVDSNTFLAVATSICFFMFFRNLNIPYIRWINSIAATTFGVFLIHANSDNMRQWLWRDVCRNVEMYDSSFLVLHAFGCVLLIFIVCAIIDRLRIIFLEKPLFKYLDKKVKTPLWNGGSK